MQYRTDRYGNRLSVLGYGCMRFSRTPAGVDMKKTEEEILKLGGGDVEMRAAKRLQNLTYDDPEFIREIIPYIHAVHGKFYEMNDAGEEPSIDYVNPLRVLAEEGWNGFIDSEYEGQRAYFDVGCDITMDCIDQVTRHQQMIRRILAGF